MEVRERRMIAFMWNVLAEERGAQELRKCSCKVT